jgi:hypothetical protein
VSRCASARTPDPEASRANRPNFSNATVFSGLSILAPAASSLADQAPLMTCRRLTLAPIREAQLAAVSKA